MTRNDSQWAAQFVVAADSFGAVTQWRSIMATILSTICPCVVKLHKTHSISNIKGSQYGPAKKPTTKQGAVGTVVFVGELHDGLPTDLFIIVHTPPAKFMTTSNLGKPFLFYIATRQELQAIKNPGKPQPKVTSDWVSYRDLKQHENCWNKLPAP